MAARRRIRKKSAGPKKAKARSKSSTKRPSAQSDLGENKALMLAHAVDGIREFAIFMLDPDGGIITWNAGSERILGYKAKEILGQNFRCFYLPEEQTRRFPEFALKEAKKVGRFEHEGWRVRKDASRFWASVVITKLTGRHGKLLGFLTFTRDLTERMLAAKALEEAHAELEQRVQKRTAALADANSKLAHREEELGNAIRACDEFITIASHELRTPITSLMLQVQMLELQLQREGGAHLQDRLQKYLDSTARQVGRLSELVEKLLDVSQAEAKRLSFQLERLDLRVLLQEAVERFRPEVEGQGGSLELEAPEPVHAVLDRFRIDQLFVNLLQNALKYAPTARIHVALHRSGKWARLEVHDNGPGLPADFEERLFGRFERGHNAKNMGGLGLGLFISQKIVEGHQGTIRAESRPGEGTRMIVELPLDLPPGPWEASRVG